LSPLSTFAVSVFSFGAPRTSPWAATSVDDVVVASVALAP
jgi:hypothetical protein